MLYWEWIPESGLVAKQSYLRVESEHAMCAYVCVCVRGSMCEWARSTAVREGTKRKHPKAWNGWAGAACDENITRVGACARWWWAQVSGVFGAGFCLEDHHRLPLPPNQKGCRSVQRRRAAVSLHVSTHSALNVQVGCN